VDIPWTHVKIAAHRLITHHFGHAQLFSPAIAFILGFALTPGAPAN
jgi:hypothetical protein